MCVCVLSAERVSDIFTDYFSGLGLGFFFVNLQCTCRVCLSVSVCVLQEHAVLNLAAYQAEGEKTIYFTPAAVTRFLIQSGL